jgi:serine phosphatase RsbU (regulator of sigma subunit)
MKSNLQGYEGITDFKPPILLVLGSNPFERKGFKEFKADNYEIINLKYLPSLCQVTSLSPDLVLVNLHGQKDETLSHLIALCREIKGQYGEKLPLVCLSSESLHKQLHEIDFAKLWNTAISPRQISSEIGDILNSNKNQKQLWNTLEQLENFKNSVHRELEQASIFQGALFNQAIARTNLKTAYHYLFKNEIGGDFFKVFDLSVSHAGILIGDVRGRGAGAALLTGFILGELYAISSEKQRILWSPPQLLAHLSESIYQHNKMSELCATAWYGVIDLTSGKISYARAGHPTPLYISSNSQEAHQVEGGSGFPLGIFPGMTYRSHQMKIPLGSRIVLYTDGLLNQKDINTSPLSASWLQDCLNKAHKESRPLKDLPAIVDSTFTDLCKGAEVSDDRLILCCELATVNEAYVRVTPEAYLEEESKLAQIQFDQIQIMLDQVIATFESKLSAEDLNEFEIALLELMNKAQAQVNKAWLIANTIGQECKAEGFTLNWWIHQDRVDISVTLDNGSIPWIYARECRGNEFDKLEDASGLVLFFDNIQVSNNGMEISMNKEFS